MSVCYPSCCKHSSIVQGLTFRSFHVISHCCPRYTEFRSTFTCRLDMRLFYRSSDSSSCFFSCLLPSTSRPVFNTAKSKSANFPIDKCCFPWWSLIKSFLESSHNLCH
ncbi:hypothetical protein C0J52_27109 [Blattella germanica]|nr:hypothetical protein C0J52_27109 [Blattella germanica]